jgi:hypothetical protein
MTYSALLEILMLNGKISEPEAEQVISAYRKLKVLKRNAHDGYQIVHGGFFDRETIQRALSR